MDNMERYLRKFDECVHTLIDYQIQVLYCRAFTIRLPFPPRWTIIKLLMLIALIIITLAFCVWSVIEGDPTRPRQVAQYIMTAAMMFGCHWSAIDALFATSFERRVFWHQALAISANVLGWVHGIVAVNKWPFLGNRHWMMLSGAAFGVISIALVVTALDPVRRQLWNNFKKLHVFLNVLMIFAAFFHRSYWVLLGLLAIVMHRYMTMRPRQTQCLAITLPGKVIRLTLPSMPYEFESGQWSHLILRDIHHSEKHPFSYSSPSTVRRNADSTKPVTIHIKAEGGDWCQKLYEKVKTHEDRTRMPGYDVEPLQMECLIGPPHGQTEINLNKYRYFIFVGGGSGITPLQSICNHLLTVRSKEGRRPVIKRILFVASFRKLDEMGAFFEKDRQWAGPLNQLDDAPQAFLNAINQTGTERLSSVGNLPQVPAPTDASLSFAHSSPSLQLSNRTETPPSRRKIIDPLALPSTNHSRRSSFDVLTAGSLPRIDSRGSLTSVGTATMHNECVLDRKLYITRVKEEELEQEIEKAVAGGMHPALRNFIELGRPNFEQLLRDMAYMAYCDRVQENWKNDKPIAVLSCGPTSLVEEVRQLCRSRLGATFDFHSERFTF